MSVKKISEPIPTFEATVANFLDHIAVRLESEFIDEIVSNSDSENFSQVALSNSVKIIVLRKLVAKIKSEAAKRLM